MLKNQLNIKGKLSNIYTWFYSLFTLTVLTMAKVFSLPFWFPLPGSFEYSTIRLRWFLVVFTWACIQIFLVVHPAVGSSRKVLSLRMHRSAVHFVLQFTDVIPDLCHQKEQKIKGAGRSLKFWVQQKKVIVQRCHLAIKYSWKEGDIFFNFACVIVELLHWIMSTVHTGVTSINS